MIARHRGDKRIHSRWRPGDSATTLPPRSTQANQFRQAHRPRAPGARPAGRQTATIVGDDRHRCGDRRGGDREPTAAPPYRRRNPPLPSTPRQWIEQWTAASMDNPDRVCRQLFAPALATVFKADTGRSCLDYYNELNARSCRIRHFLVDGNAAAVEVREVGLTPKLGYVTMILSHVERAGRRSTSSPAARCARDETTTPQSLIERVNRVGPSPQHVRSWRRSPASGTSWLAQPPALAGPSPSRGRAARHCAHSDEEPGPIAPAHAR